MGSAARKTRLTSARIQATVNAMARSGHPVLATRLCANGDVILLTDAAPVALVTSEDDVSAWDAAIGDEDRA